MYMYMYMCIYIIVYLLHFSNKLWIDGKTCTPPCYYHLLKVFNLFDKDTATLWPCICTLSWSKYRLSWHLESLTGVYSVSKGGVLLDLRSTCLGSARSSARCLTIHHYCAPYTCAPEQRPAFKEIFTHTRSSWDRTCLTKATWIQGGKAESTSLPSPPLCPETHFFTYPNRMMHKGHKLAIHKRNTNSTHTYNVRIYSTC